MSYLKPVLISLLVSLSLMLYYDRFISIRSLQTVYVFDVVKYNNAKRAMLSSMLGENNLTENADQLSTLAYVGKNTLKMIASIAGEGATVVVKQSVISGNVVDITDRVLEEFGLPLDVPSIKLLDASKYNDMASTSFEGSDAMAYAKNLFSNRRQMIESDNDRIASRKIEELLP